MCEKDRNIYFLIEPESNYKDEEYKKKSEQAKVLFDKIINANKDKIKQDLTSYVYIEIKDSSVFIVFNILLSKKIMNERIEIFKNDHEIDIDNDLLKSYDSLFHYNQKNIKNFNYNLEHLMKEHTNNN